MGVAGRPLSQPLHIHCVHCLLRPIISGFICVESQFHNRFVIIAISKLAKDVNRGKAHSHALTAAHTISLVLQQ